MRGFAAHSRIVVWLKILLPLAALGLLSTLFLFSASRDALDSLPFAQALEIDGQGVANPHYAGTTKQGDRITMQAERAWPQMGGDVMASNLSLNIVTPQGSRLELTASDAHLQEATRQIALSGGVRVETSQGYVVTTQALTAAMDQIAGHSHGPVEGHGPIGQLNAGRMVITSGAAEGEVQIDFTEGVKMVYLPAKKESIE